MADTELQQLIIYVGTTAKIDEASSAGTITENDLAISTDAPDYQEKLNQAQMEAVNSGITSGGVLQIITNKNNIASEVTNRQNADNDLQSQIDAITASSDVTDIVGTYAELQAYDTSSLPPNSIIKVLNDESQNDETTYYRWVITQGTGSWVLIGEEGPYYTKSQADERFATAAQGAKADSAVQSVATGNTNGTLSVDGTDVPVKGLGSAAYTPSTDYATAQQGTKADSALQAGDDVSELNNDAGYISNAGIFYWGE